VLKHTPYKVIIILMLLSMNPLIAQTWSIPERITPYVTGSYIILSQGLTVDSSGEPWCGWVAETYNPTAYNIYISHYSDTVWSVSDTIYPFAYFENCHLTTDAHGNVWVVSDEGGYAVSACFFDGNSWSDLMAVPTQGTCCHDPVASSDSFGNLWVCWAGKGPGDGHHIWGNAYIAGQWGSPVLISYTGSPEEFTYSMTTDTQGRVWVGWYRFSCPDRGICVSLNDGSSWSDTMMITGYPNSYFTRGPALTVDTSGMLWAGWVGCDSANNWYVYASNYNGNTWSTPVLVSSEPTVSYSEIAITGDDAGIVWLTWMNLDTNICYSYWNGSNWSNPAPVDTYTTGDRLTEMTFDGEKIWVTWIREISSNLYGVYASYTYGVGVEEQTINPLHSGSVLCQSSPNPFISNTTIYYQLPSDRYVTLRIYNITGELVRTLVSKPQVAGHHVVGWNGKDDKHIQLPDGVYFIQLATADYKETSKVIMLKQP